MTNFEMLKAMDLNALVYYISVNVHPCDWCAYHGELCSGAGCKTGIRKWMNQEAKE